MEALLEAINLAGNRLKLAQVLGIDNTNITQWVKRKKVPSRHAIKMQELYGIEISRFAWPPEPDL